ncbi:MAG: cyclic nucleotide-binding domain-containing protein [Candidatus Rokubacteria bacterium]|nr:cyclic nucleotide-binding domain-containing protein [Candidatus Rokubacteria bacterium]
MARGVGRWLAWARDPEQMRRVALLERAPLFAGLPPRLLGRLAARFFEKAYGAGEAVFHEGEPGKGLFVVLEGAVAITRATPDGDQVLSTLGPGACFGELALIDDSPRSASARVTAPSRLLILYKSDFDALVEGSRRIGLVVMRTLLRTLAAYARRSPMPLADRGAVLTEASPLGGGSGSPGPSGAP